MKTLVKDAQKRIDYESRFPASYTDFFDSSFFATPGMALIDSNGIIVAVNAHWTALAQDSGAELSRIGPGANYLATWRKASAPSAVARKAITGVDSVLKGKTPCFTMDYVCKHGVGPAHVRLTATPVAYGNARAVIAHTDITDLLLSKENDLRRLQQFARRLINAQEEERQRIARELHDDIGNRIALMSLSVRHLTKPSREDLDSHLDELYSILHDITDLSTALRNLSHGLHPAPLRCLGIRSALKSLQVGFEKTYGMQMNIVLPQDMPRLPDDVELCIFRITQECLQNIGKHSRADRARIVLKYTSKQIRLTVSDRGRGFVPAEAMQKGGLGLLSMEERALSIGGKLTVNSTPQDGTEISLTIPIRPDWKLLSA